MSNHHYEAIKHHIIILVLNKGALYLTATSSCRTPEEGAAHFTISQQQTKTKTESYLAYMQIYFGRSSPFNFSLLVRLFHHLGLWRTQHARQTKVCKGRRLLLSLGTLLPAAASTSSSLLAPSSCHVSGDAWVYVHGCPSCSRIPSSSGSGSGCHIQHELVPTAMCVDLLLLFSLVCFMASIGKASS